MSATATTPDQPTAGASQPPSSISPSSAVANILVETQNADGFLGESAEHKEDDAAADGPPKPKKPRLPRIAEACIRCKSRKQRCIRDGPGSCKNCQGVNAECIIAPRARRKNAKKPPPGAEGGDAIASTSAAQISAPSPTAFVSAPSPSSLSNLLRADSGPYGTSIPRPPYPSAGTLYPYQPSPYSLSPQFSSHALPLYAPPNPLLGTHRSPFPPPPPPPASHPAFGSPSMPPPHLSPMHHGSPPLSFSAPLSAVRSDHLPNGTGPAASLSPASVVGATPSSQASGSNRPGTAGGELANGSVTDGLRRESLGSTPLPIKGDGDALHYEDEEDDEDEAEDEAEWPDKVAKGVAFVALSANGNPTYIGPSSGFSWARMVLAGISGAAAAEGGKYGKQPTHFETSEPLRQLSLPHQALADDALSSIPDELAELILSQTYRHVQPRYPFLDWLYVHEIWQHRLVITRTATQPNASKALKTAAFFIWMLTACGSRFCQKMAIPSLQSPEAYYAKAMEHLETIVGLHDLKNVQALMLMVMFSFRSAEAPSIWYIVGIIVRLCCSLGLHRRVPAVQARRMTPYILQLRRRIFWTAYTLDRMLAMSLGRPLGIADHDIDIELPLDYDCVSATFDLQNPPAGATSMTSSILFIKLMRIYSLIHTTAYRVDRPNTERPEPLLRMLDEWETQIPPIAGDEQCYSVPCCSRDWFLWRSADAKMYLLRPRTLDPATAEPELIAHIARYAADACEIQKRLHQNPTSTLSLEGLRSIFLGGLTLLHAVRLDPKCLPFSALQRAIRANSNTMFAYAQTYRGASAYGEVFDELASAVLDKLTAPDEPQEPPKPPVNLSTPAATPLFQSLWEDIPNMMTNEAQDSFTALLESLGVPTDSLVPASGAYSAAVNSTGMGLDLSEIGAFAPTSGLEMEPFALGSSAGGLW
ncbi:hypothetical protein JCM10207_002353 [Rhodosporidiobolus poonsookiae]